MSKTELGKGSMPGPWELEAGRKFKTQSGEFYITYGEDRYHKPKFKDFCQLDANARLIAKAPLLVEALDVLIESLPYVEESEQFNGPIAGTRLSERIRNLLTKLEAE